MKIATYNIWNHEIGKRENQLIDEINKLDADIIGLQEVPPSFFARMIVNTEYNYHAYAASDKYKGTGDFVAIVSKHPIEEHYTFVKNDSGDDINAQSVIFAIGDVRFSFTNLHLPWDSVLEKEKQIAAIQKFICTQRDKAHFFLLAGDFNCGVNSSVHQYLIGDRSLHDSEANPYWNDLSGVHASLNNYPITPTLDFSTNPRWDGKNSTHVPAIVDRIYVMECMGGKFWDYDWDLKNVTVFGKEVSTETGFAPSDHYGVLAEVNFEI